MGPGEPEILQTLLPIAGYGFLALMAVVILLGIVRANRGPKKLHALAARLAAKHGGRVTPGRWKRPVVTIVRGPVRYEIEWWRGQLGKHRRGPSTWITLGPADARAAPAYPPFLAVGRHRGGYASDVELTHLDVDLGDPELRRVLRIHATEPAAVAAFLGAEARTRLLQRPDWETTCFRDGALGDADDDAPAVSLLRVTIPGHVLDESEIDAALALLDALARRR